MKSLSHIIYTIAFGIASCVCVSASEPAGYYSSCEGKNSQALLQALYNTITSHTTVSYDGLMSLYQKSDTYAEDGKIWDMYSTKHWATGSKCGSYKLVGDCYNREHSLPKSWFDDASPMYSDAFHVYPTDGKVNGQRSNFPYGECANGTRLPSNGGVNALGRLGSCTFDGYTGTVFEPDDEYKGDFARSYFYMAACYNDRIRSWSSPMLAGNSYPVFSTWAKALLLKWHRQDPVSQKELDRQEAVYAAQHNRNPFIDHPELAEYIWGDKTSDKWSASGTAEPTINKPSDGARVNMGITAVGTPISTQVAILTSNVTQAVTLRTDNSLFTVAPGTISAAAANAGATATVTYTPTATGTHGTTLIVSCGNLSSYLELSAQTVSGVPVDEAADVSDDSFTVRWTYVGDADKSLYTLNVWDTDGYIDGFPRKVSATAGSCVVDGLEADTEYSFRLDSRSMQSATRTVRTAVAVPSVEFYYDGTLYLSALPGEASDIAEIIVDTDNIDSPYTVTVREPFELSADRTNWSSTITLSPDGTRMYIRLLSELAGTYETVIRATWDGHIWDDAVAQGVVSGQAAFFEDFEQPYTGNDKTGYSTKTYQGSACTWELQDALIGAPSQDSTHSGDQCLRLGKNAGGMVQMSADRDRGIGTVSFFARAFGSDGQSVVAVEYSKDHGSSWEEAGRATVSGTNYVEHKVAVNTPGAVRMRLRQISGKRWNVDDIAITDSTTGLDDPAADRHCWDAWSTGGRLYIDCRNADGADVAIYSIDGATAFSGHLTAGLHSLDTLARNTYYIIVVADFSRTVVIR